MAKNYEEKMTKTTTGIDTATTKRRGRPPKKAKPVPGDEMNDLAMMKAISKGPEDLEGRAIAAIKADEGQTNTSAASTDETNNDASVDYVFTGELVVVGKVSGKEVKKMITVGTDRVGMRALVQQYDSQQRNRIRSENRLRAIMQGKDDAIDDTVVNAMKLIVDSEIILEKNILEIIKAVSEHNKVCQWMNRIVGIGPRLSSFYVSYIDIHKAHYHSSIDHYCGYNIQNAPTYTDAQVDMILDRALGDRKIITHDDIELISARTGRKVEFLYEHGRPQNKETGEFGKFTRTSLHAALKIAYYNREMRKLMWLITDQFRRRSGPASIDPNTGRPKSLYGWIYREARIDMLARNEDKCFAEQAYEILQTRNIKSKEALKWLENGMLTPGHIELRAQRKAGSVFNYHVWGAMHLDAFPGEQIPRPYPIIFCGHSDYIEPEVPYEDFFEVPEGGFYKPLPKDPELAQVNRPRIEIWK